MLAIVIADQEKARSLSSAKRMFNPTKILKTHQQKGKMASRFFILLGAKTLIKPRKKHKKMAINLLY